MGLKIMVCRFPYGMQEHSDTVDWLLGALPELEAHPAVETVYRARIADTPVDMSRNRALKAALDAQVDYVVMLDSDMAPDLLGDEPGAVPFLPSALDFALSLNRPCVVAAPYCSGPPEERVLVMRWTATESDDPGANFRLEPFGRDEAATMTGFGEVAALATGLMLIDTRVCAALPTPWFHYEWNDPERTTKASTEDVVFSRNLHLLGVPQFCAWDSWAGHHKTKLVGKPRPVPAGAVPAALRKAAARQKAG